MTSESESPVLALKGLSTGIKGLKPRELAGEEIGYAEEPFVRLRNSGVYVYGRRV